MSTDHSTGSSDKVTKYVVLRIPKNLRFRLSLRARVALARLVRIGPISAMKMADEHLGHLLRRERGLAEALNELQELGLAKHDREGWRAVEPKGEIHAGFHWLKTGTGQWYNRYQYTKIPLPKERPWRKSNALELWCVYWVMKDVARSGKLTLGKLCRALGITKKTARNAIDTLVSLGHIVRADGKMQLLKITDQFLTYEGKDYSDADEESPLAAALRELGIRDPDLIIEKGQTIGLFGKELLTFATRMHKKHNAAEWGDDPSKFILAAMKDSRNHRARGGRR